MGWLRYSTTVSWLKRQAITVDNSAGVAAVTLDVDVTIPKDWDDFWSVIDNAGDKIRVTGPDGVTAVPYDIDDGAGGAFNAAAVTARTGRIRVDGMTIPTGTSGMFLLWLYFEPDGTVTDGSSAVVMAAVASGDIDHAAPHGPWMFSYQPQVPRSSDPRDTAFKAPSEQVAIFIRLDLAMERHQRQSGGSLAREEPYYLTMSVRSILDADVSSMYSLAAARFGWDNKSRTLWAKVPVKAGTTDTRYTVVPTIHTVVPFAPTAIYQTLQPRLGLAVRATIFES